MLGTWIKRATVAAVAVLSSSLAYAAELYWAGSSSGLHRVSTEGGPSTFVADNGVPYYAKMWIQDQKVYWITIGDQKLMRSNLDGSQPQEIDPGTVSAELLLNIHGGVNVPGQVEPLYDLDSDPVTERSFTPNAAVAADYAQGKLYYVGGWNDGNAGILGRSNLDGSDPQILLQNLNIQDYTVDLVIDTVVGKLYWTNPNMSAIQRANLDGSGLEDVATGVDATAIALVPEPLGAPAAIVVLLTVIQRRRRAPSHRPPAAY